MNELLIELQPHLLAILGVILGYVGVRLNTYFNKKIDEQKQEQIKDVIKGVVAFVEQVSKTDLELVGKAKFELAKEKAVLLLNEKGFAISEVELEMLIEAFVGGLTNDIEK